MSQIISFINMKGGVAKTTLCVNVGYALSELHSKKVLIVDCDPQFNASTYLMSNKQYLSHIEDPMKHTVLDIFKRRETMPDTVTGKSAYGHRPTLDSCTCRIWSSGGAVLDLIPSTLHLMDIETSTRRTEDRLYRFLQEKASNYDYVLIDCPPTTSIFTQAAILASSKYLVPVKPDPLSIIGLPLLEKWLSDFTEDAGLKVSSLGIVFSMVRHPTPNAMARVMSDLRSIRKTQVFRSELGFSTNIAESVEKHKPVYRYAPATKWANEVKSIATEFLARIGGGS